MERVKLTTSKRGRGTGKGRGPGSINKFSVQNIAQARKDWNELPHEFLYRVAQTGYVEISGKRQKVPDELRMRCAAYAAPYYAPRLAAVSVKSNPPMIPYDLSKLRDVPPEELQVVNRVLGILFGQEFQQRPMLEVQTAQVDSTAYEETL